MRALFVVGNSRSGTSMMSRIMGLHSSIYAFRHELHFFEEKYDPMQYVKNIPLEDAIDLFSWLLCITREGYLIHGSPLKYQEEANSIVQQLPFPIFATDVYALFLKYIAENNKKIIICEQTPRYLFFVDDILKIFPDAVVINMIRDPRDTLLSQKNKWRMRYLGAEKTVPFSETIRSYLNYHPYTMSILWRKGIIEANRHEFNNRFISIRYEDIVTSPEKTIEDLCQKIGIPFQEQMLKVPVEGSSTSVSNKEMKAIVNFVGKWKKGGLSASEIFIVEKITSSCLENLGYKKSGSKPNIILILWWILLFPIKMSFALFFSLGRVKNIFRSIARRI